MPPLLHWGAARARGPSMNVIPPYRGPNSASATTVFVARSPLPGRALSAAKTMRRLSSPATAAPG